MQNVVWFFGWLVCMVPSLTLAATPSEFVAAEKSVTAQVELFEFDDPRVQKRAVALAKTLRCPQCQNQNLVESNSPIAKDLRLIVFTMMNQGSSEQEVVTYMTDRFGDFVLYRPRFTFANLLLWGTPALLLIVFIFLSWRHVSRVKHS